MKEAPGSSETSVPTRTTRRNNPEDTIFHSHRRENLKTSLLLFKLFWWIQPRYSPVIFSLHLRRNNEIKVHFADVWSSECHPELPHHLHFCL
jgi:hypothetical protein